ncbi:MAG: hypothetical protein AAGU21_13395 [Solidesulfovibrio sp.]|jgi:hypothetical protein|uniref:hypothetical protein n=1 Tax=Solidesulfovibrio sp. TaxID=2910990 RepID=UPI002B21EFFA|nr:hypothetical protein [Solidesulfovibrio sp.]MEA4857466.1 hypothetical protein [Solidesulfovibrio sp.]
MNTLDKFLSRKLLAAACSIAVIAVNRKWSLGLSDEEIRSVTDIALAAIGSQAGIDLAERVLPLLSRKPAATPGGAAHGA